MKLSKIALVTEKHWSWILNRVPFKTLEMAAWKWSPWQYFSVHTLSAHFEFLLWQLTLRARFECSLRELAFKARYECSPWVLALSAHFEFPLGKYTSRSYIECLLWELALNASFDSLEWALGLVCTLLCWRRQLHELNELLQLLLWCFISNCSIPAFILCFV